MQKMGINKSKNNIKYYKVIKENKKIHIDKDINEISSTIIKSSIIDCTFIKKNDSIRLTVKIDIKIIYSINNETSLYVYQESYINSINIDIPKIIDGNFISDKFFESKLIKEVSTENISVKLIKSKILISYFLTVNIKVNPTFYLAYIIDNGFTDNVFLSYLNGENLVQKTFANNMKCFNIKYEPNTNNIYFLGTSDGTTNIYEISEENKTVNKITNVNKKENIINFSFKNKNEIIFTKSIENTYNIYSLNIKKNIIKNIINDNTFYINTDPYYDKNNNIIYFLSDKNNLNFLYYVDKNLNIIPLFEFLNVIKYYVSNSGENVILKIIKDKRDTLYILNYASQILNPINFNFEYEDILDVKFRYDDNYDKKIVVLIKEKNKEDYKYKNKLILYDLNTYEGKSIIEGEIVSFEIDYITLDIYIINKKKNIYYVEKIDLNNKIETILKLPSYIKEIDIKKVSYEK